MSNIIVKTNKGQAGNALPRLDGEGADIVPGSMLAVVGLFVFALQSRFAFSEVEPLPWAWSSTLKPSDTEDGTPLPEGSPRRLYIGSAYNIEANTRNYRPAIIVGRSGDVTVAKVVIDNYLGGIQQTGAKAHHIMATMPLMIYCESETPGESSTIGEAVWVFLLATRDIYRKDFGFHELSEPTLGDTVPAKKDKEVWVTPVSFYVTYDIRWGTVPIAPRLRELVVNLIQRRKEPLEDILIQVAQFGGIDS